VARANHTRHFGDNSDKSKIIELHKQLADSKLVVATLGERVADRNAEINDLQIKMAANNAEIKKLRTDLESIGSYKDARLKELELQKIKDDISIKKLQAALQKKKTEILKKQQDVKTTTVIESTLPETPKKIIANKIALFTSINANYVKYAVTSYASYEKQNPGKFDFFIITADRLTDAEDALCERSNITVIYQDLSTVFKIGKDWPYPSECFWIYKGPEIFNQLGYKYSMSVDVDTYCVQPLNLKWLNNIKMIGAAERRQGRLYPNQKVTCYGFLEQVGKVSEIEKHFNRKYNREILGVNSGVLFFNNQSCVDNKFYEGMVSLFNKTKQLGYPRKGDDSLLSMYLMLMDPELLTHVGPEWNYYYLYEEDEQNDILQTINIAHLHRHKPWDFSRIGHIRNQNILKILENWKQLTLDMKHKEPQLEQSVWWYRPQKGYNFGDEITPWLVQKIFGVHLKKPCNLSDPNVVLGVGSIMRLANPNTTVWGSGIRNIDQADFGQAKEWVAVRGRFSQKQIENLGWKCPKVFGDPGMLLPLYYNPKPPKKYKIGIVPHLVDWEQINRMWGNLPDVKIIDLNTNDIESVVDQMMECEHIASTSLHGIITAVAYKLPVVWLRASDMINGDDIKFYDFWSSIDYTVFTRWNDQPNSHKPHFNPIPINQIQDPLQIQQLTHQHDLQQFNTKRLLKAIPLKIQRS